MRTTMDRGVAQARADGARPQLALLGTMLLLGVGYALLVSAPVVFQRFSLSTGSGGFGSFSNATWLPAAAASGFAVGGAAALLFVLARLVRDIERQPYACIAPVLGVFTAFVLAGVRAQLPLHGFGSEHFSALAMGVAVLGGALVQMRGIVPGLLGVLVTLAPAATLVAVIAGSMKRFDEPAILALDPKLRLFTVLLAAASLILVAASLVSRAIVARVIVRSRARHLIPGELTPISPASEAAMWNNLRQRADAQPARAPRITRQQITSAIDSIDIEDLAWTSGFPRARSRGTPGWLAAVLTLITLVAVGAFGYRAFLWHKNREAQLAMELRANEERQARLFAEAREARAREVAASQAQLAAAAVAAPADPSSTTPVLSAAGVPGIVPPAPSAPPAVVMPTLEEQKQKAELEAQADREAQAARDAEAKAARDAEAAAKAQAAAQAKAERDAKAAALAEQRRLAEEAREARHAERERRKREREQAIAAAERKRELAARYAAQKKEKEQKKERAARDKAVSGMLDSNKDPIFGL